MNKALRFIGYSLIYSFSNRFHVEQDYDFEFSKTMDL
jgi:hypothetical protein